MGRSKGGISSNYNNNYKEGGTLSMLESSPEALGTCYRQAEEEEVVAR
jgi:hypothetical protein